VNEGDILTLRVVKINIPERRLGLSLKKVNSAEYLDQDWADFAASPGALASESGGAEVPEPEAPESEPVIPDEPEVETPTTDAESESGEA